MKLTHNEIDYLLNVARENRDSSAALAELPGQRWAAAHRSEVGMMDRLIEKLEGMKNPPAPKYKSRRHEIVLADGTHHGEVLHSTSSRSNLQSYVQEVTGRINAGELRVEDVWLREIRETPITAILDVCTSEAKGNGKEGGSHD